MADPFANRRMLQRAVALHQSGRVAEAVPLYERLAKRTPRDANVLSLLGIAQYQLANLPSAAAALQRAIEIDPALPDAEYNLARVLQGMGQYEAALGHYKNSVARSPGDAESLCNLGTVFAALGRHNEAISAYETAIALKPGYPEAWFNLGNAFASLGRHSDAVQAFERAIALRPDFTSAQSALGLALNALNRHTEAVARLQRAVALAPTEIEPRINLGYALSALDRHAEAAEQFERAVALGPERVEPLVNLGIALNALDRAEASLQCFERALAIQPGCSDALWNKCLLHLSRGQFAEGWPLFEHRWSVTLAGGPRPYKQERWRGDRVAGPLLIWGEQGLGEQIMFAALAKELSGRADRLMLEVEPRLVTLLARSLPGIEILPLQMQLCDKDVVSHAPLGDLCQHLRPDRVSFDRAGGAYLTVDKARAADLGQRLRTTDRHVIGLSWISKARNTATAKSARLEDLLPILQIPNCTFVDLQYGDTEEERISLERTFGIRVERLTDIDNTNDIDGLAALIAACDAVVTVSNTTAHLAGGLGKPTWVLVPYAYGRLWYWLRAGREAPFYRSIRLCRQHMDQRWVDLSSSIVDEVTELLSSGAPNVSCGRHTGV